MELLLLVVFPSRFVDVHLRNKEEAPLQTFEVNTSFLSSWFKQDSRSEAEESRVLVLEGVTYLPDEIARVEREGVVDLVAVALELTGGEVSEVAFSARNDEVFVWVDLTVVDSFLPKRRVGSVSEFSDEDVVEGE